MALPPVGAQLIVFGGKYDINTQTDVILDSIARAGYAAVEGGARDAALYKQKLDERGLVYGGSHTGLRALQDVTPLVEYLRGVGGSDLCNSGLLRWGDLTAEDYRQAIPLLNEAGRKLRDEGVRFHYHHHDFEFKKVDGGKSGMDLLMEGLDPEAVDFCIDVAWVQKGGEDPAQYLVRHKDRIGYLHFKDFNDAGWIELGQGKVDFAAIMQVLPDITGARWVMIEQDSTAIDPVDSVAISRRYLKDTFGY
ncbi:MAG: TIM barrel protein [Armatimonadetes bacterium]|nr:TIM barrel protein [Armatimonadota bacterium]